MIRCFRPVQLRQRILLAWGICVLLCPGVWSADDELFSSPAKLQTYQDIIAARPAPDLTTLARRSSPKTQGEEATESFWDLLKLRETPDAKAVPVLEKILVENGPTTRIHGFAAAEALFCIGTAEAHRILARYEPADARLAVDYTSHWEMKEPLRSRYIERYLLKNLSKSLVVEVEQVAAPTQPDGRVNLVVSFRNSSDEAFHILDNSRDFPGDMLFLRDAAGQYPSRIHGRTMCKGQQGYIELKPGQVHRVNATIDVTAADDQKKVPRTTGKLIANVPEAGHFFDIATPGRFEILALFEAVPLTDEGRTFLKVDRDWKWWTGRAVSKPLSIDIGRSAVPASGK